ncbi:hypothetical protein MG293_019549 [Ovis ammon polii]|uniref:Uncharacterized protein n=1 Tax=Ovis ammon polii TaxID=230172 RepID=A0AAD4TS71_OVIAM|nr:hypothetical protein MG293_019549 [Ovis ammon polii]KAI4550961.1 hypothetical protein MJT46_018468 [Ovis ammon polii x Ovis aries]
MQVPLQPCWALSGKKSSCDLQPNIHTSPVTIRVFGLKERTEGTKRICVFTNSIPVYITRSDCMFFTLPYTLVQRETWRTSPACTQNGHSVTDSEASVLLGKKRWSASGLMLPLASLCCRSTQTCETERPPYLKRQPAVILCPLPCGGVLLSTTCLHVYSCLQFTSHLDSKNSVPLPHQVYCNRHTINID